MVRDKEPIFAFNALFHSYMYSETFNRKQYLMWLPKVALNLQERLSVQTRCRALAMWLNDDQFQPAKHLSTNILIRTYLLTQVD